MRRIILSCLALPCVLLSLTGPAAAQNVSIQLTPQGLPIQIPGPGGSFNYVIAATNNGASPQQATVWCMVTLPNGNPYGPVLGPVIITLNPGQALDRLRTQNVPAGAPAGEYLFNAYIGVYPDSIWDSDSFAFEKQLAGTQLWVAIYDASSQDEAYAIAVDSGGDVYVTGGISTPNWTDYSTLKYDASGNQLWEARYNGPGNSLDTPTALAVDVNGNVYVTGESYGSGNHSDYATLKYDAFGNQLWEARYNGPMDEDDWPAALAVDGSGNVYVTGIRDLGSGTYYDDYATIKYGASGNQIWMRSYNGPGNGHDNASSVTVDNVGNVYVTGCSKGTTTWYDIATIKYDANGNQLWVTRYNNPENNYDGGASIVVDDSGNVYVMGSSSQSGPHPEYNDFVTIKYSASGNQLWVARYNGPADDNDAAIGVALGSDGNVYVTGRSEGSGTELDYATIKYHNASGNELWVARYNGWANGGDYVESFALDGNDNVYVTGWSFSSGNACEYATIKYDASGNQLWAALYHAAANAVDGANSLAVDGGGNVYVTGGSHSFTYNEDYATIKYSGGNIDNWMPVEATVFGQSAWGGPQEFSLNQNYPNPFNASTVLSYQLPVASHVSLRVYDMAGRLAETLVEGWRAAGVHELTFDASDLPSGMYFARLEAGDYVGVQKMILLK